MKTTLLKLFTLMLLLILAETGCKKEGNTLKTGKVIFYTNAQAMLNCGSFPVAITVDDIDAGSISDPYVADRLPDGANTSSTLMLEKTTGKHNYTARIECGQYGYWTGEFEILNDNCGYIFLDIKDCVQNK